MGFFKGPATHLEPGFGHESTEHAVPVALGHDNTTDPLTVPMHDKIRHDCSPPEPPTPNGTGRTTARKINHLHN